MKKTLYVILFCFMCNFSYGQYEKGYYYSNDGNKISGLLKFKYGGNIFTDKSDGDCTLLFKSEKGGKKKKFTTNDISSFVIENDSFAIVKNFSINSFANYPQDFAQVLESGKLNLYLYFATVTQNNMTSTVTYWLIEKNGKVDKLTKKAFKNLFPEYLSDLPSLANKVSSKELRYNDTRKIVQEYNTYFKNTDNNTYE